MYNNLMEENDISYDISYIVCLIIFNQLLQL